MNPEQAKSSVRWAVATFGGAVAGFLAGKGWVSADTVMSLLSSEVFVSLATSALMLVWGLFVHTQNNAVAVVDEIAKDKTSNVEGVIMAPTAAGVAQAQALPGNTTVVAGTAAAANLAKAA